MLPQQPQFDGLIEQVVRLFLQFISNALPQVLGLRRKIKELEARNTALTKKNQELAADNVMLGRVIVIGFVACLLFFLWLSNKQCTA